MPYLYTLFIALFITGCVSAHKDHMTQSLDQSGDPDFKVSVEKNDTLSTKNFVVLEFTLENKGDNFKRYESIDLDIPKKLNNDVKVVVGKDLANWAEGIRNKIELDTYNRAMIMSGVVALGAVTAVASKDPNVSIGAASVAAAGSGIITVDRFQQIRNSVKDSPKSDLRGLIPENHILYTPVSVPPNLFLKRFAVFHVTSEAAYNFRTLNLSFNTKKSANGEEKPQRLMARFRDKTSTMDLRTSRGYIKCQAPGEVMEFRGFKISCLEQCENLHPFNQKQCKDRYRMKYM